MREYVTLNEFSGALLKEYNKWLGEHITMIDRLTGEVIVAVNTYTQKAVKNVKVPVDITKGYGWHSALEVYLEEKGHEVSV